MRKILDKENAERKTKRNAIIVGIILVGLMLVSTIGYSFMSNERTSELITVYKGTKFYFSDGYWQGKIGENSIYLLNNPNKLIPLEKELTKLEDYSNQPVYFYSEDSTASQIIMMNLYGIAQRFQEVCIGGIERCNPELPIKDCNSNLFIIKKSNISSVERDLKCVKIYGPEENLTILAESAIYKILN